METKNSKSNQVQKFESTNTGFLQIFYSKIPRLFSYFSSHGMTISLTLLKQ